MFPKSTEQIKMIALLVTKFLRFHSCAQSIAVQLFRDLEEVEKYKAEATLLTLAWALQERQILSP